MRHSFRCECEQGWLLNLLSHNRFGRLLRWREMAASSVVRRAQQLHRELAPRRGINHRDCCCRRKPGESLTVGEKNAGRGEAVSACV